jgi:SAM-dependent methyltransferase
MRATVFDLPHVLPLTRQYIASEGLTDRVEARPGNYHTDDLGEGYDLVFLSAILHSNSPDENRTLIAKCARALNPGGRVAVQEFIVDEDRTAPPFAALFALNMLVGTAAGDTFTESEVAGWMADAGLSRVRRQDTDFGTTLILGHRDG